MAGDASDQDAAVHDESDLDRRDFPALVARYQAPVRGFLARLCRNYDLADDLAQEVFITLHGKLDTFQGRGSFEGWLYRIAYNHFLQHQRASARRREVMAGYADAFAVDPQRFEAITPEQVDLEEALARLNPAEAAAISLCHTCGFSHGEAAAILQAPLGTVKSNIARGMEKLRRMLAVAGEDGET